MKRDFANVIKLRILRWGNFPGLSGWVLNVITCVLLRARQREIDQKDRTHVISEARCYVDGFEDRGKDHEPTCSSRC